MTQEAFARELVVSLSNVRNWELRGIMPRSETISEIARILRVSAAWLLTGEDGPFDELTTLTIYETMTDFERIARRNLAKPRFLSAAERAETKDALRGADEARRMLGLKPSSELDAEIARRLAVLRAEREARRLMEGTRRTGRNGEAGSPPAAGGDAPGSL